MSTKKPCCKATLVEVREHILFLAPRISLHFPSDTPRQVLEKLAATIESVIDVDHDQDIVDALARIADNLEQICPACGGSGRSGK